MRALTCPRPGFAVCPDLLPDFPYLAPPICPATLFIIVHSEELAEIEAIMLRGASLSDHHAGTEERKNIKAVFNLGSATEQIEGPRHSAATRLITVICPWDRSQPASGPTSQHFDSFPPLIGDISVIFAPYKPGLDRILLLLLFPKSPSTVEHSFFSFKLKP